MSQLELAQALTTKTQQLCSGLEDGVADLFDWVTPTTAELLSWWFGEEAKTTRRLNFHDGQRQAILNTIVAHEVLNAKDLMHLYQAVAPEALSASALRGLSTIIHKPSRRGKGCRLQNQSSKVPKTLFSRIR